MVILRPTQKLRSVLPLSADVIGESDTALGDWYVNRLVVDRRPLLVLISSKAYLPLLLPARDVRTLPERLPMLVATTLRRMSVPPELIAAEVAAMQPVVIAPTRDRSVLGIMNDTAFRIPYHLEAGGWDDTTLPFVEANLATTPWNVTKRGADVVYADRDAPRLLEEKWRVRA